MQGKSTSSRPKSGELRLNARRNRTLDKLPKLIASKRIHWGCDAHGTQFREVIRYFKLPVSYDKSGTGRKAALGDRDIVESDETCLLETL